MPQLNTLYGTPTSLTITLNSLAASATVGRQSSVVDNSSQKALDTVIQLSITVGTVSGNKQILVYVAGSFDGGSTYSLSNGANVIGASDAAFTRVDPSCDGPAKVLPVPSSSIAYICYLSVAQCFGGVMPDHWALVVFNDSGASLSGSGNSAKYTPINIQSV